MHNTNITNLGQSLESLSMELFRNAGYSVICDSNLGLSADFCASESEEGSLYLVNCKASMSVEYRTPSQLAGVVARFCEAATSAGAIPVLLVFALVSDNQRQQYSQLDDKLVIMDIANILYAAQGTPLETEIVATLPFVTDQIDRKEGKINLSFLMHEDEATSLIKQLKACSAGTEDSAEYESACLDALKYTFSSDLALFREQRCSNAGLYRFDVVTRIKDGVDSVFWGMMERYFRSKYIVFEFKNYKQPITQREVYTTERYLYEKALRRVAIIIAQNGFDDHAQWAAKGSLREQGKLMLLLTTSDLEDMLELKQQGDDPSGILLNKVDELLLDLEK